MEDECGVSDKSLGIPRSNSKVSVGAKRARLEVKEGSEFGQKRVKMRDLESVFRSEERTTTDLMHLSAHHASRAIDLNTTLCAPGNEVTDNDATCVDGINSLPSFRKQEMGSGYNSLNSKGFGFDLKAGDICSAIKHDPFHPYKNYEHLKSKDGSECGSSVGPVEEKDPMKVWKEMKQNGFLSSSHGGLPMPKPRGRKNKNDGIERKMELARKEQVDRFAKVAAPSGLLNGLNPGIINHVRNSKQVHSIIEALVRSEKIENGNAERKEVEGKKSGIKDFGKRKDMKKMNGSEMNRYSISHEAGSMNAFPGSKKRSEYSASLNNSVSLNSELTGGDNGPCILDMRAFRSMNCFSHPSTDSEDDILALKLSSSTAVASENTSSLSNEESANLTSVTSLSVRAASVASQWLELLHQDIKGRLAALRRSKKRVRAVIYTELPFLFSKEFPSTQKNDSSIKKSSIPCESDYTATNAHLAKWNALFGQMDKTLSEEERQLESWLNQVREMQLHCEQGLLKYRTICGLQQPSTFENDCSRLYKADSSDRDLAVRAAAASIYSTCNFLSSMENLHCC